jgi:hypothetical protein
MRVAVDVVNRQGQSAKVEGSVSVCAQEAEGDGVPEVVRSSACEVVVQDGIVRPLQAPAGVPVVRTGLRWGLGGGDVSTAYQHLEHGQEGVARASQAYVIFTLSVRELHFE